MGVGAAGDTRSQCCGHVVAVPQVGGLHPRYERRAAGVRTVPPHSSHGIGVPPGGRFSPRESAAHRERLTTEGRLRPEARPFPPTRPRCGQRPSPFQARATSAPDSDGSSDRHRRERAAIRKSRRRMALQVPLRVPVQKCNLSPIWIDLPDSLVPETVPNLVPMSIRPSGAPNVVWLKRLKNSARNSRFFASSNAHFL